MAEAKWPKWKLANFDHFIQLLFRMIIFEELAKWLREGKGRG